MVKIKNLLEIISRYGGDEIFEASFKSESECPFVRLMIDGCARFIFPPSPSLPASMLAMLRDFMTCGASIKCAIAHHKGKYLWVDLSFDYDEIISLKTIYLEWLADLPEKEASLSSYRKELLYAVLVYLQYGCFC